MCLCARAAPFVKDVFGAGSRRSGFGASQQTAAIRRHFFSAERLANVKTIQRHAEAFITPRGNQVSAQLPLSLYRGTTDREHLPQRLGGLT